MRIGFLPLTFSSTIQLLTDLVGVIYVVADAIHLTPKRRLEAPKQEG